MSFHDVEGNSWHSARRGARFVKGSTKSSASSSRMRRLGHLRHPLLIGALGVGAIGAGIALSSLRPVRRSGRADRFRTLILTSIPPQQLQGIDVRVDVGEGFGKPALVSVDLGVNEAENNEDLQVTELLDAVTRVLWNNGELAPVAIRARFLQVTTSSDVPVSDEDPDGNEGGEDGKAPRHRDESAGELARHAHDTQRSVTELANMMTLGFSDEIARPADLFARYGAPESDPTWRP